MGCAVGKLSSSIKMPIGWAAAHDHCYSCHLGGIARALLYVVLPYRMIWNLKPEAPFYIVTSRVLQSCALGVVCSE